MKFTIIIDTIKIRKFFVSKWFIILLSFIMLSSTVFALNVAITTFSSGNPALASEVNTNFNNLKSVFNTTTGYIPYDDGTRLSSSGIYYNSSNSNIGIGMTNPMARLNLPYGNVGDNSILVGSINDLGANDFGIAIAIPSGSIHWPLGITKNGARIAGFNFDGGLITQAIASESNANSYFMGNLGIGMTSPTSKLQVVGLPEYADNATALANGLTAGAFYRTGDLLKVVH